ncbi:MAG: DEAD/DEAH box helicase [Candidatus Eremiobacteraeota bacterium]|nr:DEAD/DEAH box helicase [Candidatus Eremiobacteraeota bacterium]
MTATLKSKRIWRQIDENSQVVAVAHELIREGEQFTLTDDQRRAITAINDGLKRGIYEFLLKAPTGSGKTEVMLRVAVTEVLRTGGYACIVAPTRDLVRQHVTYFRDRLEHTELGVAEIHGGISPEQRRAVSEGIDNGSIRFIMGSAMMLSSEQWWNRIDRGAMLFVDDVNAYDEREHLRLLEKLDCPMVFSTATPSEVKAFLTRIGAYGNLITMHRMPFDVLPTKIHKLEGVLGEPPPEQLSRAEKFIRHHLHARSRIFVVGRTRGDIPRLAARLTSTYELPVQQMRGDMADSSAHGKRHARRGVKVHGAGTRIEMMRDFKSQAPSILAATNLIGSGLDIPAADLVVITDADAFGEADVEQLIGRVGRRERPSDAVLITGTTFERNPSKAAAPGRRRSFMPTGMRSNSLRFR